jgi:hypothetical protein
MAQNNLLSPIGFGLKISKTPNVEYLVQQVSIPGLELGTASTPSPFVAIPRPGNLSYGELRVTFKVGEDLASYLEIFNWMVALGHPDNFQQYKPDISDGSIIILSSAKRPIVSVDFTDMFPVSLSSLDFDATLTDVQYMTVDATFKFTRFYYNFI